LDCQPPLSNPSGSEVCPALSERSAVMAIRRWLGFFTSPPRLGGQCSGAGRRAPPRARLSVEQLEDRRVPSVQGGPPVVFVGDSITALYQTSPPWAGSSSPLGAAHERIRAIHA